MSASNLRVAMSALAREVVGRSGGAPTSTTEPGRRFNAKHHWLDHVPFDLNRVSPLVIAGLDRQSMLKRRCAALPQWFRPRQVSIDARVKPTHNERDCTDPNGIRSRAGSV